MQGEGLREKNVKKPNHLSTNNPVALVCEKLNTLVHWDSISVFWLEWNTHQVQQVVCKEPVGDLYVPAIEKMKALGSIGSAFIV